MDKRNQTGADRYDVIVVGGGPAGSVAAWSLAQRGVKVAVVERAIFPREKVCGDFVEPGGLRILRAMQCRGILDHAMRLPITHTRIFVKSRVAYQGPIPYYKEKGGLPAFGLIIPRYELDARLLDCAAAASAAVYEGCAAVELSRDNGFVRVGLRSRERYFALKARFIVGADGVESTVARNFGLRRNDRRYISIAQRAYVEGISTIESEAAVWFDDDLFPGYGWMFPISQDRANVGVGVLSESSHRYGLSVPQLFHAFVEKLRVRHPGCGRIRVVGKPIGGVVKMYGGLGCNHFDGGVLVGDAGSFVDPMTGEGITPGMESALIASSTIIEALERGRFDVPFLAQFERNFRRYFDPSMRFLDLCATIMRNRHLKEFCFRAVERGLKEAAIDPRFARIAGAGFGGLEVRPLSIIGQLLSKTLVYIVDGSKQMLSDFLSGRADRPAEWIGDLGAWNRGWSHSLRDDPSWHRSWLADVIKKSVLLQATLWTTSNPRINGALSPLRKTLDGAI